MINLFPSTSVDIPSLLLSHHHQFPPQPVAQNPIDVREVAANLVDAIIIITNPPPPLLRNTRGDPEVARPDITAVEVVIHTALETNQGINHVTIDMISIIETRVKVMSRKKTKI
jgi:hypothetical protein